jgi:O-antigen ligase
VDPSHKTRDDASPSRDLHRILLPLLTGTAAGASLFLGGSANIELVLICGAAALIGVTWIFFPDGRLRVERVVVILSAACVLLPSISTVALGGATYLRPELLLVVAVWALYSLGHLVSASHAPLRRTPGSRWFLIFGGAILASMAWAATALDSWPSYRDLLELIKLGEYVLCFLLPATAAAGTLSTARTIRQLTLLLLLSLAFGFLQYYDALGVNAILSPIYAPTQMEGLLKYHRITGTTSNPNEFGALMVLGGAISLSAALSQKEGRKFYSIAFVLFAVGVVLTISRTALVSFAVVTVMVLLFSHERQDSLPRSGVRMAKRLVFILLLAFLLLQVAPSEFLPSVQQLANPGGASSWQGRLEKWEPALTAWSVSPLFGWGPAKEGMPTVVDNEWFLLLRRYGAIGVAVFVLWFATFYRRLGRMVRTANDSSTVALARALRALIIAYAVFMIPAGVYQNYQLMPILMLLLGLVFSRCSIPLQAE